MRSTDFDYALPAAQIAQAPTDRREDARLLLLDRSTPIHAHHHVADLPELIPPGALLVVNDARVIPARLRGRKLTGGRLELLLIEPLGAQDGREVWRCLGGASKPIRPGPVQLLGDRPPTAEVLRVEGELVEVALQAPAGETLLAALDRVGETPLPPYIDRERPTSSDLERYQTVYARVPGAVAAPTAGLHFSRELLRALELRGVRRAAVTLHVGLGTFAPLRTEELDRVELHAERYEVPGETVAAIEETRAAGRPVVAVGTTVVRALESAVSQEGVLRAGAGSTRLFIRPGHRFRSFDWLLTNFHLPRSSLLVLVAAFAGRARTLEAYAAAVQAGYRFFSYGDAMLIR